MKNSTIFQGNVSSVSNTPFSPVPRSIAIFVIAFVTGNIVSGTFGNGCVCFRLLRRRHFRKVPHYLLGNLALTGVLTSLFNMPLLVVMTSVSYFQIRDCPVVEILCKVGFSLTFPCMSLNAMTLWLMAFDRQDCVLRPFNRRVTTSNIKKLILATWMFALIIFVLFSISIRKAPNACVEFYPYNNLKTKLFHDKFFIVLHSVVGQFDKITFLIVIITFFRIKKALRPIAMNPLHQLLRRREKRITSLTYKLCGIFLLLRLPVIICHMMLPRIESVQETTIKTANLVSNAMLHLMYVANPVFHHKMLRIRPPNQRGAIAVEPVRRTACVREYQNDGGETQSQSMTYDTKL